MNKKIKSFALSILLVIPFIYSYAQQKTKAAASNWRMQPVHVPTRWAKDVSPTNVLKEYPRPQLVRQNWQNLNGLWQYAISGKDADIPKQFDGHILVPFPLESALSGIEKQLMPDQLLWYKRIIDCPSIPTNERLLLHFGAVDWQTTVFVNGRQIGIHTGGYQNFSFDITDYIKRGANELLVKVYDPTDRGPNPHGKQVLNPQNIYYTSTSGIWQTVWIEKVPAIHVTSIRTTPDIDNSVIRVTVNVSKENSNLKVKVTAKTNGRIVKSVNGKTGTTIELPITKARLWTPDDPFLYDLNIKLLQGSKVIDKVDSYFGMRKIDIQKDEKGIDRIFLNNKYTYNLGTLDQGYWPDGIYTAPTDEALAFDIKAIKAMGFNTIRKHIKIEPARWYYHADQIGILVWQDFVNPPHGLPDSSKQIFENEVRATIDQLYNHPSIITWVLFNERWGAYDQKRLTEWVKLYDPSRLVNGHSGELLYVNDRLRARADSPYISSDMVDVHSYPDPMAVPYLPGKARVLGEFGGIGVPVPEHEWNDLQGWGYIQVTPMELVGKYEIMLKRLKKLEIEGLSGSIYTQPFDVEGEVNGLLTYDREIIKIPINQLQDVHQEFVPRMRKGVLNPESSIAENVNINDTDQRFPELLNEYEKGKRDSAFLRRLTLMAHRKKDKINATKISNDYIAGLKEPYSKKNLIFIRQVTQTSNDSGFKLFQSNPEKVNAILGGNAAELKIKEVIHQEEIAPYISDSNITPDWDAIHKSIISKYGNLFEEYVLGQQMIYYINKKDWESFGKYYVSYFEKAVMHSDYNINNVSWYIFLYINDPKILEFAVKVNKINVENFDKTAEAHDTYANLLYKLGKTKEAIEWQEKAVKMSNNDTEIAKNLAKMKKGQPTWH
ncbi:sugar-binding domain-containing protein [Chitinophaga japonensis]|uniref:Glycosyl hydrolase family 2 n=1 Tax=Chitinophaga japonensis TaxID=104662 RepID=A0A562T371_CHIJA|nr:sugar-binding domain-containing protein [Chitinophaga japonensis]TWI87778.1 glycosyl hydrolase family 2 [Chitinophaga japonensis]